MKKLQAISIIIGALLLCIRADMAQLAEHNTPWRRKFYRALSLGWTGSDREWRG